MRFGVKLAPLIAAIAAIVPAQDHPTAVYTLDVERGVFAAPDVAALNARIRDWAERCRIIPGGALPVLECPPVEDAETFADEPSARAAAALFRDLDETLYLAACPDARDLERWSRARPFQNEESRRPASSESESRSDCAEIEPGHTLSTEVGAERMSVVTHGRRLYLTLLKRIERRRGIGESRLATPSRGGLPRVDQSRITTYEPIANPDIEWSPSNEPGPLRPSRATEPALRAAAPATTSLLTGRVLLHCRRSNAKIYVDRAYMGRGSLDLPLIAGDHQTVALIPGRDEPIVREFRLEPGEAITLDVCDAWGGSR